MDGNTGVRTTAALSDRLSILLRLPVHGRHNAPFKGADLVHFNSRNAGAISAIKIEGGL